MKIDDDLLLKEREVLSKRRDNINRLEIQVSQMTIQN